MAFWDRWTGRGKRDDAGTLYAAVVGRAREPHWYEAGQVPDTVDGRFDMVAAVLGFVMLRLERDPAAASTAALVTEAFVSDMDGQLRQIGIGDVVVGKHIGKMMGMLGGRLGAYRTAVADGTLGAALVRNLYRGAAPDQAALDHVVGRLTAFEAALAGTATAAVVAGDLP